MIKSKKKVNQDKYIKKYYDRDLQNSSSEVSKFIDFLIKK